MSGDPNTNAEGTDAVVRTLDALSGSVDSRFAALTASLDERFDAVDVALIEQRQYTEFAFERLSDELRAEMRAGFGAVTARLGSHDRRFTSIDKQFDSIDRRFTSIDQRLDGIDHRLDRLERKLDQFIDVQSKTNELVERRLTRSTRRPPRRR